MKKINNLLFIPMSVCILGLSEYTPHSSKKEVKNMPRLSEKKLSSSQAIKKWNDLNDESIQAFQAKKYSTVEVLSEMALELAKEHWGLRHVLTITSMDNLAIVHFKQKHYKKAEKLFVDVVSLRKEVIGKLSPETIESMQYLAGIYIVQSQYSKAESLLIEVVATNKELLGKQHPVTKKSIKNLSELKANLITKNNSDSKTLKTNLSKQNQNKVVSEKAVREWEQLSIQFLEIFRAGNYTSAENLAKQALDLVEKEFDHKSIFTLISMGNLAGLYKAQGRLEKAEPLFVEAVVLSHSFLIKNSLALA